MVRAGKSSPYFTNVEPEESTSTNPTSSPEESASPTATPIPTYKSPDGSIELILREDPNDEDDQIDGPGHGKHFVLRDLKTGVETDFGKIPGFYGAFGLLHDNQDKDQHFLFDGPLRLAFFDLHLNSTDGDTVFALDFTGPRLVRFSPNWATPIPLPGEAAFLTFTENRYVPIPGSKKTANCSYMEHWDEKLNKIRYAREKSAARLLRRVDVSTRHYADCYHAAAKLGVRTESPQARERGKPREDPHSIQKLTRDETVSITLDEALSEFDASSHRFCC